MLTAAAVEDGGDRLAAFQLGCHRMTETTDTTTRRNNNIFPTPFARKCAEKAGLPWRAATAIIIPTAISNTPTTPLTAAFSFSPPSSPGGVGGGGGGGGRNNNNNNNRRSGTPTTPAASFRPGTGTGRTATTPNTSTQQPR